MNKDWWCCKADFGEHEHTCKNPMRRGQLKAGECSFSNSTRVQKGNADMNLLDRYVELNLSNYDHEQVSQLQAWAMDAYEAIVQLTAANDSLRHWMQVAEAQHLGCGGNLKPDEVVTAMRKILQDVLENDELSAGFNNANLDDDLKQRIRDAIQ